MNFEGDVIQPLALIFVSEIINFFLRYFCFCVFVGEKKAVPEAIQLKQLSFNFNSPGRRLDYIPTPDHSALTRIW